MSIEEYLPLFRWNDSEAVLRGERLFFGDEEIPIRNSIPRFTPDATYVTGNFSLLREKHALLQMDSLNGTTDRRDTVLLRTQWPNEFFQGKLALECGCGAGPDSEVLRRLGANLVSVDLAGLDVARANLGQTGKGIFVQADITRLPFREKSFDIVFCHRVLQHTPDPEGTLDHILRFVKPGGAVFVHSYARTWQQMVRWKYALRPLTRRMDPERLHRLISRAGPSLYRLTNAIHRLPYGRRFVYQFVPFLNYGGLPKLAGMSDEQVLEYAIHDTFDALSPRFDQPISANKMREIAQRHVATPFEVVEQPTITLLRSKLRRP